MCCRSRSEYSTSIRGLVLGCGASFSTCGELHDHRIGHQSNALGYVLRVLLPVLEYWICGQVLAKESLCIQALAIRVQGTSVYVLALRI